MDYYIQKLGKFLKTDIRYVLHGGFHMSTEYFVSVFLGIGFGFLVAHILNPTEYGIYKYVLSVGSAIGAVTLTGLATVLTQSIARGKDGALKQICIAQLRWSIPALFLGFSIGGYYLFKEAYILGFSILVVTLLIPFRDLGTLSNAYLSGRELFRTKARLNIVRTIIVTVVLSLFVYFVHEAHFMVATQYILETLSFLLLLFFVIRKYPPKNDQTDGDLSFGKHLSFVDTIQRFFGQFDKLFVFQFFGATALASYSIALMPVMQLSSLSRIVRMLVAPRFAKRSLHEIHATIFHKIVVMMIFSTLIAVVYALSVPYLYKYLLPQYMSVVSMAQISAVILVFTPQTLLGQIFVAHNCKRELYIAAVLGNVFFALCVLVGGFAYGVKGAFYGFVISRGINFLIGVLQYRIVYSREVRK